MNPRKLPEFKRQLKDSVKRLKGKWRKPRGKQSKMRIHKKGKPKVVRIGYGAPKDLKYKNRAGFYEILIESINDLEKIKNLDRNLYAIRISSKVGKKKRIEIENKIKELGFKILNPKYVTS
ncbi:MAG: eL32 family ribosomal protein [Candidatus Aenigmatarchaeota archaeon]|nr:50S ribosomal protein L32e [Candidatus Aenigmarchaeota archaeon]